MIPRLRSIVLFAAAASTPYIATETELGRSAVSKLTSTLTSTVEENSTGANEGPQYDLENLISANSKKYRYEQPLAQDLGQSPYQGTGGGIVGAPVTDLREVMRFDISPEWVMNRFARVSTVLAEFRLKALRVPIVTGTRVDDLAGTLTYHFDGNDRLQRVSIHAFTGDPERLIGSMTQNYGLKQEPNLEAGIYTKRWNGLPVHFLRLTRSSVVHADALHQKYTVFLELNQPDLPFGLSEEAKKIVAYDRQNGRW
ncbi:MAG: DUF6690 family protein [Planctomycetota bacterium]|nr:DUF6690 family protein [Planctomycetota bacterium]